MSEPCNWIVFHAHPHRFQESEDEHPDFYGVFVCPVSRRGAEALLEEVLTNRNLFLAQIVESRVMKTGVDWGMYERLKLQVEQSGFGLALTKLERGLKLEE
jgi:hypothetical protein